MTRVLRVLTRVGVLGLGLYILGLALYYHGPLPSFGGGRGGFLATFVLVATAMDVAAWIGTSVASIGGVIAVVASVQRGQRGWAIALISALVLHYAFILLLSLFPSLAASLMPATVIVAADGPLLGVEAVAPLALLALVYSFLPVPAVDRPVNHRS